MQVQARRIARPPTHVRDAVQQAAVHRFLVRAVLGGVPLKRLVRSALQVVLQRLQRRLRAEGARRAREGSGTGGGSAVAGGCCPVLCPMCRGP